MDPRVTLQIGLELSDINIQGTVKPQRGSKRWNHLRDKAIEVGVGGAFDVKRALVDIIDGLVVEQYSNINVLQQWVGGQHTAVGLNNRGGDLGWWVNSEAKLWLLSIVYREALQEEKTQPRANASTNSIKNQETLETGTVISKFTNAILTEIHNFSTNPVVAMSKVIGSVLFPTD